MTTSALGIDIDCAMSNIIERSASAPSSPNERTASVLREISSIVGHVKCRRVTFPDDDTIVTGYFDAPDPWSEDLSISTDNIVAAYRAACWKQGVKPLQRVLQQLQLSNPSMKTQKSGRWSVQLTPELEFELNLKGENLDAPHCEALEEIFKRLQFRSLQLEDCHLNDEGAAAIFDMIEYYDSTSHLNISYNKNVGNQGWQACSKMLKKTPCLQYLDASHTAQNEQSLLILGRAFRTGSYLVTLHLENCGIYGRRLVILVAALKLNSTLVELYLGENKICSADGLQLGNLLRSNFTLQLLDLSSNNLQDLGIGHLIDGLCQQVPNSGECLKTLVLKNNHLTHSGMAHVNRALLVSETLVSLDLSYNAICDEGIQHMKQGLLTNQSLENLGLSNAKLTCEGAVALAEFIADNQHIASIDLTGNEIKLAGLMALALSLKHNQSMTSLKVDQTIKIDESSDGMSSRPKLLEEINNYCKRNKEKIDGETQLDKKVSFAAESADVPVIRSDAELTSLIREKTASSRSQSSGSASTTTPSMVSSASFPNGSKSSVSPSSSPRNRFQVRRVFLDSDNSQSIKDSSDLSNNNASGNEDSLQSEESVFLPSSPNESGYGSTTSQSLVNPEEPNDGEEKEIPLAFKKNYIRHQDSIAIHMQHAQSRRSNEEDEKDSEEEDDDDIISNKSPPEVISSQKEAAQSQLLARRASGGKVVKKLTFLLPEDFSENTSRMRNDRRMSTPTLTSQRLLQQKQNVLNLKLGRQLEGLDLKSSVPLSPTRLREGLSFPEPLGKYPNN